MRRIIVDLALLGVVFFGGWTLGRHQVKQAPRPQAPVVAQFPLNSSITRPSPSAVAEPYHRPFTML